MWEASQAPILIIPFILTPRLANKSDYKPMLSISFVPKQSYTFPQNKQSDPWAHYLLEEQSLLCILNTDLFQ